MANDVIRSLFSRLGFQVDKRGAEQYENRAEKVKTTLRRIGDGVDKITRGIAVSVAAAAASLGAFDRFVSGQDEAARQINAFATATGLSSDALQRYGFVARQQGVELEDFGQAMADIGERARDAVKNGGEYQEFFTALGVTLVDAGGKMKGIEQISLETFDALKKQEGSAEAVLNGMGLLGDNYVRLTPLINLGSEAIQEMASSSEAMASVISKDALKATRDLTRAKQQLADSARKIANRFLTAATPAILRAAEAIKAFLNDTERVNQAIGVLKKLGRVILAIFAAKTISTFVSIIATLPVLLVNAARAAFTASGAFGALQAALGFLPILLGGLFVALRDIHTMMQGGQSVVGDFISKFEESDGVLGSVARALRRAAPMLAALFERLMGLASQALPILQRGVEVLSTAAFGLLERLLPVVVNAITQVGQMLAKAWVKLGPAIEDLAQTFAKNIGPISSHVATIIGSILQLLAPLLPAFVANMRYGMSLIKMALPIVTLILGQVAGRFQKLMVILLPIFEAISGAITFIATVFGGTYDFIAGLLKPAANAIMRWLDRINSWLDPIIDKFLKVAKFASKIPGFGDLAKSFASNSQPTQRTFGARPPDFGGRALGAAASYQTDRRTITANQRFDIRVAAAATGAPASTLAKVAEQAFSTGNTALDHLTRSP